MTGSRSFQSGLRFDAFNTIIIVEKNEGLLKKRTAVIVKRTMVTQ